MNLWIGNILIGFGLFVIFVGLFGFFRFDDFESKLLAATVVDSTAIISILFGAVIRDGFSWFSLKVLLILGIILVLNPVMTSKIALSAKSDAERELKEAHEARLQQKLESE